MVKEALATKYRPKNISRCSGTIITGKNIRASNKNRNI